MNKLVSIPLIIAFGINTAWADETTDPYTSRVYITQDATYTVAKEDLPLTEAPVVEANIVEPTVVQPMEKIAIAIPHPAVEMPQISREDIATLHLNLIQEQVEASKSAGLFSFFSSSSEINETLLADINLFLAIYTDLPQAAQAQFLKGKVQRKLKMTEAAALSWLQVVYEYPKSDVVFNAEQRLMLLLKKDWEHFAEQVQPMLGQVLTGDRPTRLIKLINQVFLIKDKDLAQALMQLQMEFLRKFPQHPQSDEVQVLLAHNLGATSAESGVFAFKKLIALWPNSTYLAEARLAIADLQLTRLKEYENAASSYKEMIQQHPSHTLTKRAYVNLALTLEKHLRNYREAIGVLQSIVALYPEDKVALSALQTMAKLLEKKEDKPRKAVATLRQLATMFDGDAAVEALQSAIRIADRELDDQALLLEVQEQLVQDFPDSAAAPQALFDMAKLLQASEPEKSKALYQQFLQQYPQHKLVSDVKDQLEH